MRNFNIKRKINIKSFNLTQPKEAMKNGQTKCKLQDAYFLMEGTKNITGS